MNILDLTSKVHNNPKITPIGLTIHTTANRRDGATALMHDKYYDNNSDRVSVHWTVDNENAVQSVPENMAAWHSGNRDYNLSYIGMEICENNVANNKLDQATYENAVELAASILKRHGWGVDKLIQHRDVPGREWKNCPNKDLIDWDKLKADVQAELKPKVEDWKLEGLKYLYDQELLKDYEGWEKKINEPLPAWATFLIMKRIHGTIK
jgi:N-acetylmuramoyl-L-alanine amidase CwlA